MSRQVTITTTLGPLEVTFTGTGPEGWHHAHVGTAASNVGPLLTYRGKTYYVSAHLYLKPQGWAEHGERAHGDAYIVRQDPRKDVHEWDTPTIYKAIVEACAAACETVQRTQPALLSLAEHDRLVTAVRAAERDADEAFKALREAEAKRDALRTALLAHEGSVGYLAAEAQGLTTG
jgi:hypothetical protein